MTGQRALRRAYPNRGSCLTSSYPLFGMRGRLARRNRGQHVHGARKEKMNMNTSSTNSPAVLPLDRFALPRYRVSLQSAGADETRRVSFTNSAEDAVRDFLNVSELTDGSDLYIWDRQKKEIVARIEWMDEPTTFGNTIRVRSNQFYDSSLAEIARHLCERAEIRHAIVNSVAI